MRCKDYFRTLSPDRRGDFRRGAGDPGRLRPLTLLARLANHSAASQAARVEDLAPAIAEPAVANDQHLLAIRELSGNGLHAKCAAAGHEYRGVSVIHALECNQDVLHHRGEAL